MTHTEVLARRSAPASALLAASSPARGVVHVVDVDTDVRLMLISWLGAAGMDVKAHAHLGALLNAAPEERPNCVVIDAHPLSVCGFEAGAIPLPSVTRCPIIVTAYQADVAMAVKAMKSGALDFVEKPLLEEEILTAVEAAMELDRKQRFVAAQQKDLRTRYATLSRRERQVMALVTAGRLNKQVGGDLGLSEITVKAHRGAAMRKMGARTFVDLVRMADAIGDELAPD